MVLVVHALQNEEPTRKVKLGENIWFIRRFFLLIRMLRFCFLHLSLTLTVYFFFKWWHAWRLSSITSWALRDSALQTQPSRTSLLIDVGTGFIPSNSQRWHCAFFSAFLSSWKILSLNKRIQFLLTNSTEI